MFLFFLLLSAAGCATLNESECRNADWNMIGMEDGAKGKPTSYIGNHRTACAKFDVTPDITAYQQGHYEGVKQYCTELNGFLIGKKGINYNGVCPPELEMLFLDGYHYGHRIHTVQSRYSKLSSVISSKRKHIEKIEKMVIEKEELLISDISTEAQRSNLLMEIKEHQEKIGQLKTEILEKEKQRAVAKVKLDKLNRNNPYY